MLSSKYLMLPSRLGRISVGRPALLTSLLTAFVLGWETIPRPAYAGVLVVVNTLLDESVAGDRKCSLREAINNANAATDTTGGDCAPGTGNDTIVFTVSGTILGLAGYSISDSSLAIDGTGQTVVIDAKGQGAAFFVQSGSTVLLNDLAIQNGAGGGGAVTNLGTLTVTNSTFSDNVSIGSGEIDGTGFNGGGGAIFNDGTLTVISSTFSHNVALGCGDGVGGAIKNASGVVSILNSTFSRNVATLGGAIFNGQNQLLVVTDSTFLGNYASFGGGLFNDSGGVLKVEGCVLADSGFLANCGSNNSQVENDGFNIATDGTCSFGTSFGANGKTIGDNVDPLLDPAGLQDNGGPAQTIGLQSGSPAIDAMPIANCQPKDQRGAPRPDPTGALACDIGAFESGPPATAKLGLSPHPLSFGIRNTGSTHTQSLTVHASRSNLRPVVLENFFVSAGDYGHDPGTTSCEIGESLPAGASCAIGVDFTPSAKTNGQSDVGQLVVETNAQRIRPKGGVVVLKGGGK